MYTFDLSGSGLLVESLDVALFTDFQRRVDKALDELESGAVVEVARHLAVLSTSIV